MLAFFFMVRNVLIITDTVNVVISRVVLLVKSQFISPGCVKMKNSDLKLSKLSPLDVSIQDYSKQPIGVSQASKPTISTFLIANK